MQMKRWDPTDLMKLGFPFKMNRDAGYMFQFVELGEILIDTFQLRIHFRIYGLSNSRPKYTGNPDTDMRLDMKKEVKTLLMIRV
jgi:hypothetical protein